jgi:beta-N-acetylglucosaminidase
MKNKVRIFDFSDLQNKKNIAMQRITELLKSSTNMTEDQIAVFAKASIDSYLLKNMASPSKGIH